MSHVPWSIGDGSGGDRVADMLRGGGCDWRVAGENPADALSVLWCGAADGVGVELGDDVELRAIAVGPAVDPAACHAGRMSMRAVVGIGV